MEKFLSKPEILAPAGSLEAFLAAVNCGADAVYLGVNVFNARAKLDAFTTDNIADVISYAHLLKVKVYVTLNTLILDEEITEFLKTFEILYNAKADAFIMQDIGMAMLIKKLYPAAIINASTQMGIHNLDGALFVEKCGYKRVILSRETKLEDIELIRRHTETEIECFVQGALCVAFSGNCYLSSVKDGNSGNRGKCHQLCRLKYACGDSIGYLLSPRDLCLTDRVKELTDAGVTSFKIEGRMKRPSYVAAAVKAYRLAVDGADKRTVDSAVDTLSRTFKRGEYNKNAYFCGNGDIIDTEHNNNTGVFIGTVTAVRPFKDLFKVTVATDTEICVGDGLKFIGANETSIGVGTVEKTEKSAYMLVTARKGISVNDKVYKTLDVRLEKKLTENKKRLTVDCTVKAYYNKPVEMTLSCGKVCVTEVGEIVEKAKNSPLDVKQVAKQIKFGDEPFVIGDVTLETDGVFIPKSKFNELRRRAIVALKDKIIEKNSPVLPAVHPTDEQIKKAVDGFTDFSDKFKSGACYKIIKSLSEYTVKDDLSYVYSPEDYNLFEKASITDLSADFYLNLPVIATQKDTSCLDRQLSYLDGVFGRKVGVVANNYYGLKYLNERPTVVGAGLNVYNKISGGFYLSLGVKDIIASGELSGIAPFAVYAANLPLMTFAHCPYKVCADSSCSKCTAFKPLVYTDERGNKYKITRYKAFNCYFELKLFDESEYSRLVVKDKSLRKIF